MMEINPVHRGGYAIAPAMAHRRHARGVVDELHDGSAAHIACGAGFASSGDITWKTIAWLSLTVFSFG